MKIGTNIIVLAAGWVVIEAVSQLVENGLLPGLAYRLALVWFLGGLPGHRRACQNQQARCSQDGGFPPHARGLLWTVLHLNPPEG